MRRPLFVGAAIATCAALTSARAVADTSVIKRPGAHPDYVFEAEPHFAIASYQPGWGDDTGFGVGFRGTIEVHDNGFVKSINNTVGIGFGLDFIHYDDDNGYCRDRRGPGRGGCFFFDDVEANVFFLPVVMQWNFFLTRNWSVFGEPGIVFEIIESDVDDDFEVDPAFYVGGRWHFSDPATLTIRFGFPITLSIGVSFLL